MSTEQQSAEYDANRCRWCNWPVRDNYDLCDEHDSVANDLLAQGWDEGFDACFDVIGEPVKQNVPNPYRVVPPEVGAR